MKKEKLKELEDKILSLEREIILLAKKQEGIKAKISRYSIKNLMQKRGIKILKKSGIASTLIPDDKVKYKKLLSFYYFRRILQELIGKSRLEDDIKQSLKKRWGEKAYNKYIKELKALEFLKGDKLIKIPSFNNFGPILEWFIEEFIKENYKAEIIRGAVLDIKDGGDFDIIALLEREASKDFILIECKASPPNNIRVSELQSFIRRSINLKPDYIILLIDTTLKIERNIIDNLSWILKHEPEFKKEFSYNNSISQISEGVYKISPMFYIITAKRDILKNLKSVLGML